MKGPARGRWRGGGSGPPSSAAPRAFRNGFRNVSRLSVRAGSYCPLLGAPLVLKGASKTLPRRVDSFANVLCVARLSENTAKPMVFHYFLFFVLSSLGRPKTPPRRSKPPQDTPLRSQGAHKTPQDASKMPLRPPQGAPKTAPGRPQDAPKHPETPQDVPRRPKTAPRRLQDAPKTPPRRPKAPQGAPKTRAFPIFWYHFAPNNPVIRCTGCIGPLSW